MGERRGSIACYSTNKQRLPLDIFSCPVKPSLKPVELHMTDGVSYNYNGQFIPPAALKTILNRPKLSCEATEADVDSGRLTGLIFVSERENDLETLHIALYFNENSPKAKVFSLADIYGTNSFNGVRLEDSACFGGGYKIDDRTIDHFLIYVSTKEPVQVRRCPWTVVYKTNLRTGDTERLTPPGTFDLSPSVSPSGKKIAVASFQANAWDGEIECLHNHIYVMNVDNSHLGLGRRRLIVNGGWPTWGSENVLFFHRKEYYGTKPDDRSAWRVFRFDITTGETIPVTPEEFDAVTPAAINETKVAVATIRKKSKLSDVREGSQYRHIEIFDATVPGLSVWLTQRTSPRSDHFNPFVTGKRIGYHCSKINLQQNKVDIPRWHHKLSSPHKDVGLFRVSGILPSFSTDGSKLAFVDNESKAVWVADSQGLRPVYKHAGLNTCFLPVWNKNPCLDILYICFGGSVYTSESMEIMAIDNPTSHPGQLRKLTKGNFNNAFPSTDPQGKRLVFRSTRHGHMNLYIMQDAKGGEYCGGQITRLTNGRWIDTQCQWSPNGDWIVFSSSRAKPDDAPMLNDGHDPGYFAIFLVNPNEPALVLKKIQSGDDIAGYVNYPFFSPDGKSIAVNADLAGVSVDPVSLPLFQYSVRPYGDIFTIDIDPYDIRTDTYGHNFQRITHSRYENLTVSWTPFSNMDQSWTNLSNVDQKFNFLAEFNCSSELHF